MKNKIILMFLVGLVSIGLISCGNNSVSTSKTNNETTKVQVKEEKKDENKIYKKGEEAFIKDNNNVIKYSLKINSVKIANNFEYKEDFNKINASQIIEVDYTYKNIANDRAPILLHGQDLKVADETGEIGLGSSMFPKQPPQEANTGTSCTVQAYYGLTHESKSVKINFTSNSYGTNLTFDIPVEK